MMSSALHHARPGPVQRWLILLGLLLSFNLVAQRAPSEYDVKAAFLFNFLKYIDWPEGKDPHPGGEFLIAIYGANPFGNSLAALQAKEIKGRRVRFIETSEVEVALSAHIIFVASSERGNLSRLLRSARGRAILTVGEMEDFAQLGGMIQFIKQNDRVRLVGNMESLENAEIKISSNLMDIIKRGP